MSIGALRLTSGTGMRCTKYKRCPVAYTHAHRRKGGGGRTRLAPLDRINEGGPWPDPPGSATGYAHAQTITRIINHYPIIAGADPGICVRGPYPSLFPLPYSSHFLPPYPSLPSTPLLSSPLLFPPVPSYPLPSLPLPLELVSCIMW